VDILAYLIPISLILGGTGLAAFFWAMRSHQFDDLEGDAARILCDDWDDAPNPAPDAPARTG
jgi:cbb3-type cytochrome oxidase maturation protein